MPPCAATVWQRVGKTLVMQAVFSPACADAERRAQARAAGADDDDVIGVIDDRVGGHETLQRASFKMAMSTATPSAMPANLLSTRQAIFRPSDVM